MKKILLFAALGFFIHASADNVLFNFDRPISFHERGIEFFIFPDGSFDFNTQSSAGQQYYRGNGHTAFGAPLAPAGVVIEHDNFGRVRRIGNVFVNYDRDNRIKRIGTVYFTYRGPNMIQAGNLRLLYDRRGRLVDMIGSIKGRQYATNYQPAHYGAVSTSDYYYYRHDGTKELIKEIKE